MKKGKVEKASAGFSATEVGTMLEDIQKGLKVVAEGHSDLDRRLERVEVEVHGNSDRLNMLEIVTRVTKDKVSHLENAVSKLNKDLRETREELSQKLEGTEKALKKEIHELGGRLATVETGR